MKTFQNAMKYKALAIFIFGVANSIGAILGFVHLQSLTGICLSHACLGLSWLCFFLAGFLVCENIFKQAQKDIEEADSLPWTLPAPPEGREWHRNDWTAEMLPDGWRPLLTIEHVEKGDTICFDVHTDFIWTEATTQFRHASNHDDHKEWFFRTRRPLPN